MTDRYQIARWQNLMDFTAFASDPSQNLFQTFASRWKSESVWGLGFHDPFVRISDHLSAVDHPVVAYLLFSCFVCRTTLKFTVTIWVNRKRFKVELQLT